MDDGARGNFVSKSLIEQLQLLTKPTPPIPVTFGNKTTGFIDQTATIKLRIQKYQDDVTFLVMDNLNYDLILGKTWHKVLLLPSIMQITQCNLPTEDDQSLSTPLPFPSMLKLYVI